MLVFRDEDKISISFDETSTDTDRQTIINAINEKQPKKTELSENCNLNLNENFLRESPFLDEDIFKGMDEVKLTRYIHDLADKDYSLVNGMIPLGSCTMKLTPSYTHEPMTWNTIADIHPFAPEETYQGYKLLISK